MELSDTRNEVVCEDCIQEYEVVIVVLSFIPDPALLVRDCISRLIDVSFTSWTIPVTGTCLH